jgi:hypothetical protein
MWTGRTLRADTVCLLPMFGKLDVTLEGDQLPWLMYGTEGLISAVCCVCRLPKLETNTSWVISVNCSTQVRL